MIVNFKVRVVHEQYLLWTGGEWLTVVIDKALRRQLLTRYRPLLNPHGTKDRKVASVHFQLPLCLRTQIPCCDKLVIPEIKFMKKPWQVYNEDLLASVRFTSHFASSA